MKRLTLFVMIIPLIFLCCEGKKKPEEKGEEFMRFPITSADEVLSKTDVQFDKKITSDGNGSLLITVSSGSTGVRLFEIEDPDIENARIIYQAKMRSEDLLGPAYLEILCNFKGLGEFFARNTDNPLTGTTDWNTIQTSFFYREDENPDLIKLNLIITRPGKVWIDDIRLIKGPLPDVE